MRLLPAIVQHGLVLGVVGVGGLLYPLHDALDVTVFRVLMNAGAAGLIAAAIWSGVLAKRRATLAKGHGE